MQCVLRLFHALLLWDRISSVGNQPHSSSRATAAGPQHHSSDGNAGALLSSQLTTTRDSKITLVEDTTVPTSGAPSLPLAIVLIISLWHLDEWFVDSVASCSVEGSTYRTDSIVSALLLADDDLTQLRQTHWVQI